MSVNYLPRNPFAEAVGHLVLKSLGWRIEGELPKLDKFLIIGAHHTSNWDFILFIALKFVLRLNAHWFAKHSIFRWPFGALLRSWGGIPIQRHLKLNVVEQAIQNFQDSSKFILVISPEGTRKKVERWKMGFYHIARGAGVPIVLGALDYGNKRLVLGPPFWPSGDERADLEAILAFYKPFVPKRPECAFHGD